ncbi:MAG: DUF58 domain-containing protein [Candidatus Aenigmarchaeota archaeon]|nr:DUF58 domain-containing protein [Candidatus Aenigmarchaeota archaeon]
MKEKKEIMPAEPDKSESRRLSSVLGVKIRGHGDTDDPNLIMKGLINEIDKEVKKLVDVFRFMMKYQILFKGSGIEFAGLREYVPGQDDATKIDWKASLRSKSLYVKQYEEERDLFVHVLMDSSSSMFFGTQNRTKYEFANIIAGAIIYASVETGDNTGFSIFNDKVVANLEPSNENTQYYKALRLMIDHKNQHGKFDMVDALTYVLNTADPRTILFIVSDFIGLKGEEWKDVLKMLGGKLDRIIGIMVRDIRDDVLPKNIGYMKLRDPFSDRILVIDSDAARIKYEKLAAEQVKMIEDEFRNTRAGFFKVYTTDTFVRQLIKYIELSEGY